MSLTDLRFDNRFLRELPGDDSGDVRSRITPGVCWARVQPTPVDAPRLLAYAPEVAALLDFDEADVRDPRFAAVFGGNALLPGMQPFATRYGGHQFGSWAGQLGDGRAISLGEAINRHGERWELQLKGAGATPYARRADGRAVLRSSIREFLCSEAMAHLGIPTTRALSLVTTGEAVQRDMLYDGNPQDEPGAVVCRVAPSFIRFGHFQILAANGEHDLLARLLDFVIVRDYPHLVGQADARATILREVAERTARLVTEWMRVGFVHGVMNTDNMSILGLTLDYGPYGWLENFDPAWTPNTTDADWRRYCYGQQTQVARWNVERLCEALLPLLPQSVLDEAMQAFDATLRSAMSAMLAAKFGWREWQDDDGARVEEIFTLMQHAELDYTEFFRALMQLDITAPDVEALAPCAYRADLFANHRAPLAAWLQRYAARSGADAGVRGEIMRRANPRFVLRNYLAFLAIEEAAQGEVGLLHRLLAAARHPYDDDHAPELLMLRPEWARQQPGASCLSCSS